MATYPLARRRSAPSMQPIGNDGASTGSMYPMAPASPPAPPDPTIGNQNNALGHYLTPSRFSGVASPAPSMQGTVSMSPEAQTAQNRVDHSHALAEYHRSLGEWHQKNDELTGALKAVTPGKNTPIDQWLPEQRDAYNKAKSAHESHQQGKPLYPTQGGSPQMNPGMTTTTSAPSMPLHGPGGPAYQPGGQFAPPADIGTSAYQHRLHDQVERMAPSYGGYANGFPLMAPDEALGRPVKSAPNTGGGPSISTPVASLSAGGGEFSPSEINTPGASMASSPAPSLPLATMQSMQGAQTRLDQHNATTQRTATEHAATTQRTGDVRAWDADNKVLTAKVAAAKQAFQVAQSGDTTDLAAYDANIGKARDAIIAAQGEQLAHAEKHPDRRQASTRSASQPTTRASGPLGIAEQRLVKSTGAMVTIWRQPDGSYLDDQGTPIR